MRTKDNEEIEISLINCFAYAFRHWFKIAVWSVVFAALLFGYHFYTVNTGVNEEFEMEHYTWELSYKNLESQLEASELQLKIQENTVLNSPYMKLDPQKIVKVEKVFQVSAEGDEYFITDNNVLTSLSEKKTSEILAELRLMDLKTVLNSDFSSDWLKQLISFSSSSKNITVSIIYSDVKQAEAWSEIIGNCLLENKEVIQLRTTTTTTTTAGSSVAENQKNTMANYNALKESINTIKKDMKDLKKEEPSSFHPVRFAGIGFIIGFLVSCCIYILVPVINGEIACSSDMEKNLGVVCLGTVLVTKRRPVVHGILKEKVFTDKDEENKYLEESLKRAVKTGENILFVSTQDIPVQDKLSAIVKGLGASVSFVDYAEKNKALFESVEKADKIIIVEKMISASEFHVREVEGLVNRSNKTIENAICLI